MLSNNHKIMSLGYEDVVSKLAEQYSLTPEVARSVVRSLSFKEYASLLEDIVPPSEQDPGNPQINTPNNANGTDGSNTQQQQGSTQVSWPGNGSPIEQGMQVGIQDPKTGLAMPHEVVRVDQSTNGVTLKNPQTGQQQSYNQTDLVPIANTTNAGTSSQTTQPNTTQPIQPTTQALNQSTDYDLMTRILELAGVKESSSGGCSAGAVAGGTTVAGNIATVAAPLGKMKKRTPQAEESGNSTVYGKIDPNAATGELSRRLADANRKTASRKNNGKKVT